MKKVHIFILVVIAVAISVLLITLSKDGLFTTYETFASANQKNGTPVVVVGTLDKGQATEYNPLEDPNRFIFYATDKKNITHKVIFSGAKPTDFEKSEQLVMTGYMKDGDFYCNKMQMKCPSKYQNDQVALGTNPAQG